MLLTSKFVLNMLQFIWWIRNRNKVWPPRVESCT